MQEFMLKLLTSESKINGFFVKNDVKIDVENRWFLNVKNDVENRWFLDVKNDVQIDVKNRRFFVGIFLELTLN